MKTNKSKSKLILFLFPFSLVLSSCNISDYLNIKDSISNNIFPNLWDFLVQFLAFVIMSIIVVCFAYKPVKKFIETREELLNKEKSETFKNKKESEEILASSKKEIVLTHEKANKIIEEAKKEGENEKALILESASKEANKKIEEANEIIKAQKEKAKEEIKNEVSDVAISLSSKILEREVSDSDNKKLIDDFINKK